MLAKQELTSYDDGCSVWAGKYTDICSGLHWHHDYEVLYVEKGYADVCCDGKSYRIAEKQTLLVHSGAAHSIVSGSGAVIAVITFTPETGSSIMGRQKLESPVLSSDYGFAAVYDQIMRESATKNAHYQYIINSILLGFLITVVRSEKTCQAGGGATVPNTISLLLSNIDKNFAYTTAEDCANFMGFNKAYFSDYFHKAMGITFVQYLNSVKVEKAVELIRKKPPMSMTDVAMHSGFGTIRNFNRIFKSFTGYVPKRLPADYIFGKSAFAIQKTGGTHMSGNRLIESIGMLYAS